MFQLLIICGIGLFAFGLLTFGHPVLRKLGGLCVLAASFLAGYFITGQIWVGILFAGAWFFIPWVEILTRIRRMRLPLEKELNHRRPPSRELFPALPDFTEEVEMSDFVYVEDTGWQWGDIKQFVRIFYHDKRKIQATICLSEQAKAAFAYIALSSRTSDGHVWTTWNYPFAPTMKFAPELRVNRVTNAESFEELLLCHDAFLYSQGVTSPDLEEQDPNNFEALMQKEIRHQIDHNLDQGLIKLSGEGTFRYSWRGLFFLWCQFVKDMVRLS
ncbi:hypothetical protein BH23VER1_BH23VER1_25700 [soil metagenome]